MSISRNKILFAVISVALCLLIAVGAAVLSLQKLPQGKLIITDSRGEAISEDYCGDYTESVLTEALEILNGKYKLTRAELLNSDITITTYFEKEAFEALRNSVKAVDYGDEKASEAAIFTLDGKLIASFAQKGKEDIITAPHKAGSALKPLSVYAPALKNGKINWASTVEDSPIKITQADGTVREWPANYGGSYSHQAVALDYAIKKSLNTVAVRVLADITPSVSCDFLEEVGITLAYEREYAESGSYRDVYGNLALGELNEGVTPERLAAAYQIFANGGYFTKGSCIEKIECKDKALYTAQLESKQVLSDADAQIMNLLLSGVVSEGGTAAKAEIEGMKIIGKTGTSQGYRDNWFVGASPDYICAVWYGYDTEIEERGENCAIEIFKNTFLLLPHKTADFPKSEAVAELEYCVYTGKRATKGCNSTQTGYFSKDDIPEFCNRHQEN